MEEYYQYSFDLQEVSYFSFEKVLKPYYKTQDLCCVSVKNCNMLKGKMREKHNAVWQMVLYINGQLSCTADSDDIKRNIVIQNHVYMKEFVKGHILALNRLLGHK
ncbi:hypothetical protein [Bacillus wiedmannii]|uniref:hypothetical protein n=1 Tax=Bacillus wiedmannii TaxID=1890302 RepID=UPI000BECBF18|nr:hypothetical protein [Bacillus wiedmannii]PDZ42942.1 hypothetical protein CON82_26325 [Bacillus wiedmannii]